MLGTNERTNEGKDEGKDEGTDEGTGGFLELLSQLKITIYTSRDFGLMPTPSNYHWIYPYFFFDNMRS